MATDGMWTMTDDGEFILDETYAEQLQEARVTATAAWTAALIGYLAANCLWLERILLVVGGLLMIQPGLLTDAIGLTLFGAVLAYQFKRRKSEAQTV